MLSETKLQAIRRNPSTVTTKRLADKDGLYIRISTAGTITFGYDYYVGGRSGHRGTINFGQYPVVSLAQARERLLEARRLVAAGKDPQREKKAAADKVKDALTLDEWWHSYIKASPLADSTIKMRSAVYERDVNPAFGRRKLQEISSDDVRRLCDKILNRGAPAVAVHAREIINLVYRWARLKGEKVQNPTEDVTPCSIAHFKPRERCLSPHEIHAVLDAFKYIGADSSVKIASKLLLLTFVRKSELTNATWGEIDFEKKLWTIPAARMKKRAAHLVPLSDQAIDLLVALKTMAGASEYILPGRYDTSKPMANSTLNRFLFIAAEEATKHGTPVDRFGPHDLRRTASTILHERGYASDWIEKQLAHEQRGVRAVYNKAQYLDQRRGMMQDWSDIVDCFAAGNLV